MYGYLSPTVVAQPPMKKTGLRAFCFTQHLLSHSSALPVVALHDTAVGEAASQDHRTAIVELPAPIKSGLLDLVFMARSAPIEVEDLADRFALTGRERESFRNLFTVSTARPSPNLGEDVVVRNVDDVCVLLDFGRFVVLVDPCAKCTCSTPSRLWPELPDRIDLLVVSDTAPVTVCFGMLLQLRKRTVTVVLIAGHPGVLGLAGQLTALGFNCVVELREGGSFESGPAQVTAIPAGPMALRHGPLMHALVRIGGRGLVFAPALAGPPEDDAEPSAFKDVGPVDALFVGRRWTAPWGHEVAERGSGPDFAAADRRQAAYRLALRLDARNQYLYGEAMDARPLQEMAAGTPRSSSPTSGAVALSAQTETVWTPVDVDMVER